MIIRKTFAASAVVVAVHQTVDIISNNVSHKANDSNLVVTIDGLMLKRGYQSVGHAVAMKLEERTKRQRDTRITELEREIERLGDKRQKVQFGTSCNEDFGIRLGDAARKRKFKQTNNALKTAKMALDKLDSGRWAKFEDLYPEDYKLLEIVELPQRDVELSRRRVAECLADYNKKELYRRAAEGEAIAVAEVKDRADMMEERLLGV